MEVIMKVTVIGTGRWGSFIAWYIQKIGHDVTVYGEKNAPDFIALRDTGTNGTVTFKEGTPFITDLERALSSEVIIISVPSQALRGLMGEIKKQSPKNKIFVLCMKGIEISSGKRLSEVTEEFIDESCRVAVWIGPGHPQEFVRGIPNCMVIDSVDEEVKNKLVDSFSSDLIRFYYGCDLVGNEVGAAAKNVIGIAAGMLDGLELSSLKGALMSRATREVARLIVAMGGDGNSAYGLCHLGDYEATVFSEHSHNRRFGELIVKGEKFDKLAEGYYTAEAIKKLCDRYGLDMPICSEVYNVLYCGKEPKDAITGLFSRSIKKEIY